VEEEIPLQEEHSGKNYVATMEEDPATDSTAAKDFCRCYHGRGPWNKLG
jgi:hypothetical protein